jgi:hypothetical protein
MAVLGGDKTRTQANDERRVATAGSGLPTRWPGIDQDARLHPAHHLSRLFHDDRYFVHHAERHASHRVLSQAGANAFEQGAASRHGSGEGSRAGSEGLRQLGDHHGEASAMQAVSGPATQLPAPADYDQDVSEVHAAEGASALDQG